MARESKKPKGWKAFDKLARAGARAEGRSDPQGVAAEETQ